MKKQIILLSLLLAISSQIYAPKKPGKEYTIQVTNNTGKKTIINATGFEERYELPNNETMKIKIKKGEKKFFEKILPKFVSKSGAEATGPMSWLSGWNLYYIKDDQNIESATLKPDGEYVANIKDKEPKTYIVEGSDIAETFGTLLGTPEKTLGIEPIKFIKPIKEIMKEPITLTFDDWKEECMALPIKQFAKTVKPEKTFLDWELFKKEVDDFIETMKNSSFNDSKNWVGKGPKNSYFDIQNGPDYAFFAQKIIVAPDTKIILHADIHADIHSLIAFLSDLKKRGYLDNNFKIIPKNVILLFSGDYTDRGYYGAEVLSTIMKLKTANPEKVILLRGNHEDIGLNGRYGLDKELRIKFGKFPFEELQLVYNLMPSVVYIGIEGTPNYAMFCHGGIEPRFNPAKLFSKKTKIAYRWIKLDDSLKKEFKKLIKQAFGDEKYKEYTNVKNITTNGFIWGDFSLIGEDKPYVESSKRKSLILDFNHELTKQFLEYCSSKGKYEIRIIIRGHQHYPPLMTKMLENHGIYNLSSDDQWDDCKKLKLEVPQYSVWTINVSPAAFYGKLDKYKYDTYAILTLKKNFEDWTLEPKNVPIPELDNVVVEVESDHCE
ncbi:metallophosphoesterase family protein [Candidatus Dependentiae bacterium]